MIDLAIAPRRLCDGDRWCPPSYKQDETLSYDNNTFRILVIGAVVATV